MNNSINIPFNSILMYYILHNYTFTVNFLIKLNFFNKIDNPFKTCFFKLFVPRFYVGTGSWDCIKIFR